MSELELIQAPPCLFSNVLHEVTKESPLLKDASPPGVQHSTTQQLTPRPSLLAIPCFQTLSGPSEAGSPCPASGMSQNANSCKGRRSSKAESLLLSCSKPPCFPCRGQNSVTRGKRTSWALGSASLSHPRPGFT